MDLSKKLPLTMIVLALSGLSACNYSISKKSALNANAQTGLPNQSSNGQTILIDAKLIEDSVLISCKTCHHAGGRFPSLSNASDFRSSLSDAIDETRDDSMPPKGSGIAPLNACQKAILKKWADLGAPDNSVVDIATLPSCAAAPTSPTIPDPTAPLPQAPHPAGPPKSISEEPVNYQTFLTRILQPKCITCHSASGDVDAQAILFVPYAQITAKARLFAGPSSTSRFFKSVSRTDGGQMPPPDSNVPRLTAEEEAFVAKWIDAGTPEN